MANEYQGSSIVDYLKSIGKDASYQARATLASQHGITNYTGSAEQNLQLLNKLKTTTTPTSPIPTSTTPTQQQQDLSKVLTEIQKRQAAGTFTPTTDQSALIQRAQSTLPSSVTNVSQLGTTPTLPADATITTYPQVNVLEATSVSDYIQKQQEKLDADKAAAQAALSKAGLTGTGTSLQEQLFTGYLEKAPVADYQKALQEAQAMYGVTEGLAELKLQSEKVAQLKGEIEKLEIQRQNELDVANKRLASMTSIQAEKNAINERYDSQRVKLVGDYNIEAAILAAKSNYLSEANNLVQYAVQAYTASITAEINRFDNLYSLASDWVSSLNAQEKSILDDAKAELERERDLETTRLNNVLNLKLQYPNAGINPTDTLEEATAKAEKIAGSDAKLNRQLKEAQLKEAQDTTDTETQLAILYAQAQTLASSKGVSIIEAIASLPVSQDIKTNLLFFNSFTEQLEQSEKQELENRVNVEEVTPTLIQELFNLGYDLPTIKSMAKDESVLSDIEKAYKELSIQNISGVGESVGGTLSGVVDFLTDTPEEIKEIEKTLKESTGESWKFDKLKNLYISSSGKTKSKHELFVENIWKGLSENIVSPFLKGVSKAFED